MKIITRPGFRWERTNNSNGTTHLVVTAPWGDRMWDHTWHTDTRYPDTLMWCMQERLVGRQEQGR